MNDMILVTRLILATAVCITIIFLIILQPTNVVAFVAIAAWLTFPYLLMVGMFAGFQHFGARRLMAAHVLAVIVSVGGILFLAYILFGPPDAQNGIALFLTPVYQVFGLLLGLPFVAAVGGD